MSFCICVEYVKTIRIASNFQHCSGREGVLQSTIHCNLLIKTIERKLKRFSLQLTHNKEYCGNRDQRTNTHTHVLILYSAQCRPLDHCCDRYPKVLLTRTQLPRCYSRSSIHDNQQQQQQYSTRTYYYDNNKCNNRRNRPNSTAVQSYRIDLSGTNGTCLAVLILSNTVLQTGHIHSNFLIMNHTMNTTLMSTFSGTFSSFLSG